MGGVGYVIYVLWVFAGSLIIFIYYVAQCLYFAVLLIQIPETG